MIPIAKNSLLENRMATNMSLRWTTTLKSGLN